MPTVLHLTHTSVPDDARILRELNALSESADLTMHAYGVLENAAPPTPTPYVLRQFRVRSAHAFRLPRPLRYALVMIEVNTRFLTRMLKLRPEIVHCHDTMVLPAGVLAKAFLRSTLIYDAHELESDKSGQSKALSQATLLVEKVGWGRIDQLITVSPSITDWYAEHLGPKPTTCILNSPEVSSGRLQPAGATGSGLRDRLGLEREVPLVVYVGALETGRGIELILEAFAGSAVGIHVAFIGSGSLQETTKRASELHDNIHHCPPVPHDQLVDFIREATAGFCLIEDVSLSDHFCLPNKLFEYAFAGLPVIASRLPDIERFVKDYQLGTCTDLDIDSIRRAALECVAAPKDLPPERLAPLSWANQADDLRALYAGLSATKPTRLPASSASLPENPHRPRL